MASNRLHRETSPYLLQHKANPVHWTGWNPEALRQAEREDKPILLSIGYAACHWCHVMAHESFEDEATAMLMNAGFINIKVDREERPDLDRTYMAALHAMGEQGGWPLTIFLTPQGEPFWGGTYFPPESRYGRPGFKHILEEIARIWKDERHKVLASSAALTRALRQSSAPSPQDPPGRTAISTAAETLISAVDPQWGGLKGAPKFPQAPIFSFLWLAAERNLAPAAGPPVLTTLTNIVQGGIYDHLGGGMARYSVDGHWLVPHFEKMLYDNAQLISLLARACLRNDAPLFRTRLIETVSFVLRDMATPSGGFASSYDADSEGEEGKYYVWTYDEIHSALPPDVARLFTQAYGVTPEGNWEGTNILHLSPTDDAAPVLDSTELTTARATLRAIRRKRTPPGFDDKILADWNGLTIAALADAALALDRGDWQAAAAQAFTAAMGLLWTGDRLLHSHRAGQSHHEAIADDYAHMITAALRLHNLTADPQYLQAAFDLDRALTRHHWDSQTNSYLLASGLADSLITRHRYIGDDVTPNANATMIANLAGLYSLTGNKDFEDKALAIAASFAGEASSNPFAAPTYYRGIILLNDPIEILLTGEPGKRLLHEALRYTGLDVIVRHAPGSDSLAPSHPAYVAARIATGSRLLICRANTCSLPVSTAGELNEALQILGITGDAP